MCNVQYSTCILLTDSGPGEPRGTTITQLSNSRFTITNGGLDIWPVVMVGQNAQILTLRSCTFNLYGTNPCALSFGSGGSIWTIVGTRFDASTSTGTLPIITVDNGAGFIQIVGSSFVLNGASGATGLSPLRSIFVTNTTFSITNGAGAASGIRSTGGTGFVELRNVIFMVDGINQIGVDNWGSWKFDNVTFVINNGIAIRTGGGSAMSGTITLTGTRTNTDVAIGITMPETPYSVGNITVVVNNIDAFDSILTCGSNIVPFPCASGIPCLCTCTFSECACVPAPMPVPPAPVPPPTQVPPPAPPVPLAPPNPSTDAPPPPYDGTSNDNTATDAGIIVMSVILSLVAILFLMVILYFMCFKGLKI